MTVIVCQHCEDVIEYVEGEKVEVLYGTCVECRKPAIDVMTAKQERGNRGALSA